MARPEDLAHLVPDGDEVAPERVPDGLVDRRERGAAVLARDAGGQGLGGEARGGGGGGGADGAGQGGALGGGEGVVEGVEVGLCRVEELACCLCGAGQRWHTVIGVY